MAKFKGKIFNELFKRLQQWRRLETVFFKEVNVHNVLIIVQRFDIVDQDM